jgi:hypothetical protein
VASWRMDTILHARERQEQKRQCPQSFKFGVDTREHREPQSNYRKSSCAKNLNLKCGGSLRPRLETQILWTHTGQEAPFALFPVQVQNWQFLNWSCTWGLSLTYQECLSGGGRWGGHLLLSLCQPHLQS